MKLNLAHVLKMVDTLNEGYRLVETREGCYRVWKPEAVEPYLVDLQNPDQPCNCMAGINHGTCKHFTTCFAWSMLQAIVKTGGTDALLNWENAHK